MRPYYTQDGITIYHGDCRELLEELGKVDLVLTDPPYGISLKEHGRSGYNWNIDGDESQELGQWFLDRANTLPTIAFASPMKPWDGKWRQYLVWDKGPTVGGGGDPTTCWKQSWELVQVRKTGALSGKRDEAVLRFHVTQRDYHHHPCQKPVPLLSYLINKAATPETVILDPFMGSGSTLRAAKNLGKKAIGIEINEAYCEIAAKRLEQLVLI